MGYEVQTSVYEGPLDVLLHLITKQQVELYDVSISTIVDGFLAHMDQMQKTAEAEGLRLDLELTTEFLLIASTLVELKARRLLPGRDDIDLDEELSLWEERDLLLARLVECKTFKSAALALLDMEDRAKASYARRAGMEESFLHLTPDLLEGVSLDRFKNAYIRAMTPKPPPPTVSLTHVTQVRVTVTEAIENLSLALPKMRHATFRDLTKQYTERLEVIVHFLGVLEMYKQGWIEIDQAQTFGEIEVTWVGEDSDAVVDIRERALVDAYEG